MSFSLRILRTSCRNSHIPKGALGSVGDAGYVFLEHTLCPLKFILDLIPSTGHELCSWFSVPFFFVCLVPGEQDWDAGVLN